jgi:hypothetical protein
VAEEFDFGLPRACSPSPVTQHAQDLMLCEAALYTPRKGASRSVHTRPRFRFDNYWTKIEGFRDVVTVAWGGQLVDADAYRCLDHKLRTLAKVLKS